MWTRCGRNASIGDMHEIQTALLLTLEEKGIKQLPPLRKLAALMGKDKISAQQVKHHLEQLEKKGFIKIDKLTRIVSVTSSSKSDNKNLVMISLPYYGVVNCGPALNFAENKIEGYLKISKSLLRSTNINNLFVVKASGNSMNLAKINNKNIEDGDYLIVDPNKQSEGKGEIVLSIIDGMANVKKLDKTEDYLVLSSVSTEQFPPIYIDSSVDYSMNGIVTDVLKKPQ